MNPSLLCCRLALLLCGALIPVIAASENYFKQFDVAAHTSAATRDDIETGIDRAKPGDTITFSFVPPDGYVMTSSEVTDQTPLGWVPIGIGRFRLVVPVGKPWGSSHQAEFYGKLERITTGGAGGETTTPEEFYWGVKGKIRLAGGHEGIGVDANRKPPADTAFQKPSPPSGAVPKGRATVDASEVFSASDGGEEYGTYTGALESEPQISTVALPPVETRKCPQDGQDDVKFAYRGVADGIKLYIRPDTIQIDTEPSFDDFNAIRRRYLHDKWVTIEAGTRTHEDLHRADAYRVAEACAAFLRTARAYGYAPTERKALDLSLLAADEFLVAALDSFGDRIDEEGEAFDRRTNHGLTP